MKKLILTGCAAALFSIGAIAQVQDTASINNNLRQGAQETEERTEEAGDELQQKTEQAGEEVKEDAQEAGNELRQGAEQTGEQIEQGAERAGEQMEQGAERAQDSLNQESPSSQNPPAQDPNESSMGANTSQPQPAEIEVLEDKEGPNNQVVYKYQGELYYVDREQKQLVKIEESQLKDAEHKAIVSDDQQDNNRQK